MCAVPHIFSDVLTKKVITFPDSKNSKRGSNSSLSKASSFFELLKKKLGCGLWSVLPTDLQFDLMY